MQTRDIIRAVLDLLDAVEQSNDTVAPPEHDDISRFKQIFAILSNKNNGPLGNSPNEIVAPVDSVTVDAGGGVNGPKHPADIKGEHPSMYPGQPWGAK